MSSRQGKIPIRRDNLYRLAPGKAYPSTTDITSSINKPYLIPWAAKVAAAAVLADPYKYDTAEKAAAVVNETKSDAAGRGKAVHDLVEAWANGAPVPATLVPESLKGYHQAFLDFTHNWRVEPKYTEVVVYNDTYKYAGRLDLIGVVHGRTWLVDFKTSKSVYKEYGLQLAAYKNAEFIWHEDREPEPMPAVDHCGIVLLGANGLFDLKPVDEPFEVFLALKEVWTWMRSYGA